MAELRIPIVVENKGKKAFKDVDKGINGLSKSFKKMAGLAGIGLGAAALVNFGKKAAKAFIADEKAASQLAVSVKNLGLAFETPRIEQFISNLSKASGVADDVLRPSMQKLLQTTGSVAKSTELLTQALDISRGSGVDYETVVNDLTMAYVGQTKGLNKYKLGLTKAELAAMSFTDIQKELNNQFKGANAAYLDTFAGKMEILGTAAGEAQEIIGKGLVDALMILSGDTTVEGLALSMEELAVNTSNVIVEIAKLGKAIANFATTSYGKVDNFADDITDFLDRLTGNEERIAQRNRPTMGGYPSSALGVFPTYVDPNEAARKAAEAAALKRAKELAKLQAKSLADAKKKAALEKASGVLDIERIGIAAALKGQISETDRLSLNLQLALLDKNDAAAIKLSGQLTEAVKRQNDLNALLLATPEAPNPYRNWRAPDMGGFVGPTAPSTPTAPANPLKIPYGQPVPNFNVPDYVKNSYSQVGPMGGLRAGVIAGVNPAPINITVELDGVTVGGAIRDGSINDSLSGSFNTVNRSGFKGAVAIG
jgi:hypothetical protein